MKISREFGCGRNYVWFFYFFVKGIRWVWVLLDVNGIRFGGGEGGRGIGFDFWRYDKVLIKDSLSKCYYVGVLYEVVFMNF